MAEIPAGQVSVYLLMNLRSICYAVVTSQPALNLHSTHNTFTV